METTLLDLGPTEWMAIRLSLKVALWATCLSLPLAIYVAILLAREKFWGKQALNILVHMPLIMPPVVTGYLLLIVFGRNTTVGHFLENTIGLVLAAAIMAFPLMVLSIRLAAENIDPNLEEAARTMGASPAMVLTSVTLPLMLPGIVAGAILAFAKALGEFGATITFVSNIEGQTQTLPSAIYSFLQVPGGDQSALLLVGIAVLISILALVASEILGARVRARVGGR